MTQGTLISAVAAEKLLNLFCAKRYMSYPEFPLRVMRKINHVICGEVGPGYLASRVEKDIQVGFKRLAMYLPEFHYRKFKDYYKSVLDRISNIQ